MSKSEKFISLFATKATGQFLNHHPMMGSPTSYTLLLNSLSDLDVDELLKTKAFFIVLVSPASQDVLLQDLSKGSTIIGFDRHIFKYFDEYEVTAMLLHEIGHALAPNLKKLEGELNADKYAADRGYADYMISGLRKGVLRGLPGFKEDDVYHTRIKRLEEFSSIK